MSQMRWAWLCGRIGHHWLADARVRVPNDGFLTVRVSTYRCTRCWRLHHVPYTGSDAAPGRWG